MVDVSDVAGLLIDVDGVLHNDDVPVPGAPEALQTIRQANLPYVLLTNSTMRTRAALASKLSEIGFPVEAGQLLTAAAATADYLRREHPGEVCYLLAEGDALAEFEGIPFSSDEPEVEVVIIGGAGSSFTFERLNRVYRMLKGGAALVAMHKSVSWWTSAGLTMDSGPYIHGLEWATGAQATVVGKPSRPFFEAGYRQLGLDPHQVAMISDSNPQDVQPAMSFGSLGILVRTGVFEERDLQAGAPDLVLDSLADLPAVLGLASVDSAS